MDTNEELENRTPETIDEFKIWYAKKGLPPENITRFFIGKDYLEPRAFGIYKNEITGEFIVYKNKSDGSRSIRYQGTDEAYAVRELYLRLEEEIRNQNSTNNYRPRSSYGSNDTSDKIKETIENTVGRTKSGIGTAIKSTFFGIIVFVFFTIFQLFSGFFSIYDGYYRYNDSYYYHLNSSWYTYSNISGWNRGTPPDEVKKNYKEYYLGSSYSYNYDVDNFEYTSYYQDAQDRDSDYSSSSDSSWSSSDDSWSSSDDWDSSSTDWDSDW